MRVATAEAPAEFADVTSEEEFKAVLRRKVAEKVLLNDVPRTMAALQSAVPPEQRQPKRTSSIGACDTSKSKLWWRSSLPTGLQPHAA